MWGSTSDQERDDPDDHQNDLHNPLLHQFSVSLPSSRVRETIQFLIRKAREDLDRLPRASAVDEAGEERLVRAREFDGHDDISRMRASMSSAR